MRTTEGTSERWPTTLKQTNAAFEAQRAQFLEDFKNYGMLLNTMTPEELANEIRQVFRNSRQAVIVTTLLVRLIALERRLGAEE